jgi:hypothetical protein
MGNKSESAMTLRQRLVAYLNSKATSKTDMGQIG